MTNRIDSPDEFDELEQSQKETLLDWCNDFNKIKSINKNHSSYYLKHVFERSDKGFYITNGAFKGAMLECGFTYKPISDSPNWYFNVSQKSIRQMQKLNKGGY